MVSSLLHLGTSARGLLADLSLILLGVLRNIVDSDSEADQYVHIDRLTNEFALGFINELVSLDPSRTVARVFELVNEAVSVAGRQTCTAMLTIQAVQANELAGQELKTDHRSPAEAELDTIERKLNTVVIGLEVLTGICAGIQEVDAPEGEDVEDGAYRFTRQSTSNESTDHQATETRQTRTWTRTWRTRT